MLSYYCYLLVATNYPGLGEIWGDSLVVGSKAV